MANIFSSIEDNISGIIGEGVAASPNPTLGWVGSLSEIEETDGYWIKMTADDILNVSGQLTNPETLYDLHSASCQI